MSARRGIGDNAPPLEDRLALDYAALAEEIVPLAVDDVPPVDGEASVAAYSAHASSLKALAAKIEAARKVEKAPILADGRTVDGFFNTLAEPVKTATSAFVSAINAWQTAKLKAEREAQRKAEEAARIFDAEPPLAPAATKDVARVVSSSGRVVASASTVWRHRVIDPDKVPRAYLMPNDAAIKAAIAGGVRAIDGVEIFEEARTTIR